MIPGGPVASQDRDQAARHQRRRLLQHQLGHPFENPTGFTDFFELYADPAHPVRAHLHLRQHGEGQAPGPSRASRSWSIIWLAFTAARARSSRSTATRSSTAGRREPGGHLDVARRQHRGQGGPVRPAGSAIWGASTTGTSNGSVNSMHDSFTPLGGGVVLIHMKLGEVSPGGVGVGLNGMLIFVILSVFIAGLMVGRTPGVPRQEDPGDARSSSSRSTSWPCRSRCSSFLAASTFVDSRARTRRSSTPGAHGFTEVLYAFTSAGNNNGSAFAGITATHAVDEHDARASRCSSAGSSCIIPTLAIAGVARPQATGAGERRHVPDPHAAVRRPCVIGVIVVVGALTFLPVARARPDRRAARI